MRRERKVLFLMFVISLVVATPLAWARGGRQALGSANDARAADDPGKDPAGKVTICHHPPGNPSNAQTITVGQSAVAAHLAHGDTLGACPPACQPGVPSPVPKTGQTTCWDEAGNPIDCAGRGQDGEYQKGASVSPRFTDNGDGTVKDNLTGLIWLKDSNCLGFNAWSNALARANALASGECGLSDGSVAGDWRLPNVRELYSLVDFDTLLPTLPAGHPFDFIWSEAFFWSSTSRQGTPSLAFGVNFGYGHVNAEIKNAAIPTWPVRGGQ